LTPSEKKRSQRELSDSPARKSRSAAASSGTTGRTRAVEPSRSAI